MVESLCAVLLNMHVGSPTVTYISVASMVEQSGFYENERSAPWKLLLLFPKKVTAISMEVKFAYMEHMVSCQGK